MGSQRSLIGMVALLLAVTASCTRQQATPDSVAPLAPPDTLSQPTTTRPAPTTTVDIERTTIRPVDPLTLEPVSGFDPLPMGDWSDWYWSDVSDSGQWLALPTGDDRFGATQLRLVDLEAWEMVESWTVAGVGPIQVGDDGTAHLVGSTELLSYAPTPGGLRTAIDLPPAFATWYPIDLYDGHVRMFGSRQLQDVAPEAEIVDVDLATGEVTAIRLPGVEIGTVGQIRINDTSHATVDASPALIWDHPQRALLVHAIEDMVTEVDLESGAVVEHRFGPAELPVVEQAEPESQLQYAYIGNSRSAALSIDRATLYVATQIGDLEVIDQTWRTTSISSGLMAIDTTRWSITSAVDVPVSNIAISPAGDRLLGSGYTDVQGNDIYEYETTGFYVIDSSSLEVISDLQPEAPTLTSYGPVSFGPGGLGYVMTWGEGTAIDVIDLSSGAIVNTRAGSEIWLLGPIGVLGQVGSGG